jgi:outer membrane protein assembly factor BamB
MPFRYPLAAFALLLIALAPTLRAQTFVDVIDPVGNPSLWGLTWRDGTLYATDTNPDRIVQIDRTTGTVTQVAALTFDPRGIAWDGQNWRISTGFDTSDPRINTVDASGAVVGSIPAPGELTHGLELHDGLIFAAQAYPDPEAALHGLDPADGAIEETIPFPSTQPGGIAFVDENTLWATNVGDDSGSSGVYLLYEIDRTTGAVLRTLDLPEDVSRPRGLAYDGTRYLYVVARQDVSPFEYLVYVVDLQSSGNPQIVVSATALDFGARVIGGSYPLPLTISNVGDGDLEITNVQVTGPGAGAFQTDLTATTIGPGGQVNATVSFLPADPVGYSAALTFETNDVAQPVVTIPLSGHGVYAAPHAHLVEDSHDYGPVRVDVPPTVEAAAAPESAVRWPLRVVNLGAEPLVVTDVRANRPVFLPLAAGYPHTIPTLDTLVIEVEFRPLEVQAYTGGGYVFSNDPDQPDGVFRLQGEGVAPTLDGGDPLWSLAVPDNPSTGFDDPKVFSIAVPGDLTDDGRPDLVFAARNYLTFGVDGNGWGQTAVLWQHNTCPDNFNCGAVSGNAQLYEYGMETTDDLDGDGVRDVVIGTEGGHDHVTALSGATGGVIWDVGDAQGSDPYLAGYYSVSARLDVNGDGTRDVATGTGSADLANSPNPYNHRRVYLLDGETGDVAWEQSPGLPSFRTLLYKTAGEARVVAGGGESTNHFLRAYRASDGLPRFNLNPGYSPFIIEPYPAGNPATVDEDLLVSGVGTTALERRDGTYGFVVWTSAGLGTVWDVAVFNAGPGGTRVAVGTSSSLVFALDGDDGTTAWTYNLSDQVFDVARVPDASGDGVDDVAATGKAGRTVLLSGTDGALIWSYTFGDGSFDESGEVVVAVPDMDWNGVSEVAFGTRDGRGFLLFGGGGSGEGIAVEAAAVPDVFALLPAYPNPFGASATLRYHLPAASTARLTVYDLLGRAVWAHEVEGQEAGTHAVAFDARALASGVYVVRFEAGGTVQTQRMTRVR